MPKNKNPAPRQYPGVMVSSTFTDLEDHRSVLIKAIRGQEMKEVAMENDTAKSDVDVVDSSLQMVADASAYIGVISRKYGQTPLCPDRNPKGVSITELEYDEAQELHRPILLFIMGDKHPITEADIELDPAKREKLQAFRERAKQMKPGSPVHRVYDTFNSLEEFTAKANQAVANLRREIDKKPIKASPPEINDSIPAPPILHKLNYPPHPDDSLLENSSAFIGRESQLGLGSDAVEGLMKRFNSRTSISSSQDIRLIWAHGYGGMGKSWFLHRLRCLGEAKHPEICSLIVDWDRSEVWQQSARSSLDCPSEQRGRSRSQEMGRCRYDRGSKALGNLLARYGSRYLDR